MPQLTQKVSARASRITTLACAHDGGKDKRDTERRTEQRCSSVAGVVMVVISLQK